MEIFTRVKQTNHNIIIISNIFPKNSKIPDRKRFNVFLFRQNKLCVFYGIKLCFYIKSYFCTSVYFVSSQLCILLRYAQTTFTAVTVWYLYPFKDIRSLLDVTVRREFSIRMRLVETNEKKKIYIYVYIYK